MRVLLLVILCLCGGCFAHYPKFDLREPVYVVVSPEYRAECAKREIARQCIQSIRAGFEMWFSELAPEDRPKLVIARDAIDIESKNEIIFVEYEPNAAYPATFRWTERPLAITIRDVMLGPIAQYFFGHEFGHAFLGRQHESAPSMMEDGGSRLRPTAEDLNRLYSRYPYLKRSKK